MEVNRSFNNDFPRFISVLYKVYKGLLSKNHANMEKIKLILID